MCLKPIEDNELRDYLLQLVQALRHEPYHDSALARFILTRALRNQRVIGQMLFWHIRAQLHVAEYYERNCLILETYLRGIPESHLDELVHQVEVINKLTSIAEYVKKKAGPLGSPAKKKEILKTCLTYVKLPPKFILPCNPR